MIALLVVVLMGPAAAATAEEGTVVTSSAASASTLNATEALDPTESPTGTVENETVENTTDDVSGTPNDTVDSTADTVGESVDSTATILDDSTETVLSVDDELEPSTTAELVSPTPSDTSGPTADPSTETPTAAVSPADGTDGDPLGAPTEPLVGGAVVGGMVALTGFVGRELLVNGDAARGSVPSASAARGWLTGWADRLRPLLGLFGYQRYDDSSPLDHAARRRLHKAVRTDPGVHLSAVSEAADLPLSTARYHLRVLEREGLVRGVKLRGKRRYFPPDVGSEALVASLADEATANVLWTLVEDGPASVSELAERLDRDPGTVSHHLDRLSDEGLVDRDRAGREVVSSATPEVEAAVDRLRSDEPVAVARPAATD